MKALLVDTTKCMGCRGCQVACKQWHQLPAERTAFFYGDGYQNPAHRSSQTWNLVTFHEVETKNGCEWIFGRLQCFHCLEPACAAACPAGALTKTDAGPVVYDASRCLGCRYCQMVCPFNAPRFEWHSRNPQIRKCNLCADRLAESRQPACSQNCPTGALTFGKRKDLLLEAEARIAKNPDRYTNHVYGKEEVGGTCILHLARAPFDQIGYPAGLPKTPVADSTKKAMNAIPLVMTGITAVLGGLFWIINRRIEQKDETETGDDSI